MKSLIKSILKFTSIVIVLFIAIVLLINTSPFDEKLSPEVQNIMQDVPMPVVDGNAYYALFGLNAITNKDMIEAGHKLTMRYIENRKNGNDGISTNDYIEILGAKNKHYSDWGIEFKACDSMKNFNCLVDFSEGLSSEKLNNSRLQTMLNRYHKIIEMKVFSNFLDITWITPLAAYSELLKLSQIKLATSYQPKNRSKFIQHLHKDMVFWKMLLNQDKLLIGKMIAVAGISKDINYLSEYLRNNPITESDSLQIKEILAPLTPDELDISESFILENRGLYNMLLLLDSTSTWYENLIYQPNATINYSYDKGLKNLLRLSQLSLKNLILEYAKERKTQKADYKIHYLYNFFGKTLIDISGAAYIDYISRVYELNNIIKMADILYQSKMSKQSIQQLLAIPNNYNPFNNKPFEYNEKDNMLHFECLNKNVQCRIKL